MSDAEEQLLEGEKILYETNQHWIIFSTSVLWAITSLLLLYYFTTALILFAAVTLLFSVVTGIEALISFLTSEYVITNQRILTKQGFLRKRTIDLPLQNIDNMKISRGIFGQLLKYGNITLHTVNGAQGVLEKIPNPQKFKKNAQSQIETMLEQVAAEHA